MTSPWPTVALIAVLFVATAVGLVKVARMSKTESGDPQPHAFGAPPGTVRAILALALAFTFIGMAVQFGIAGAPTNDNAAKLADKAFVAVATALATVLGFYFGSGGAKTAVADMTKALRQQAGAGDQKSAAASAEAAVKAAQAAADRARKVHDRLHAMLREAQASKPADMTTKLLAEDVAQVDAAAKKSAQAAADAAARVKEVAKRSKDLASIAAPERRTELEAEIAEIMTKLMADVADAESHANKAQKIASRRL